MDNCRLLSFTEDSLSLSLCYSLSLLCLSPSLLPLLLRFSFSPSLTPSLPLSLSYQYAIYSIVVRGWCFCNGHAAACDPPPGITQMLPGMVCECFTCVCHHLCVCVCVCVCVSSPTAVVQVNSECRCSGNTAGVNCEQCQPLFNDRPWLPANGPTPTPDTTRECKGKTTHAHAHTHTQTILKYFSFSASECQCYGRASSCHFDPQVAMETGGSGGVCDNCTHRTTGRQCDQCVAGFYRNTSTLLSDPNLCIRKFFHRFISPV